MQASGSIFFEVMRRIEAADLIWNVDADSIS
jgi:hypothetical protein